MFHYFLCSLPLPLFLQGWKGCLLTSGVVSIYLLGKVGSKGSMKQELIDIVFTSLVVFLFLCLFLLLKGCIWVKKAHWLLKGGPAKLSQLKLLTLLWAGEVGKGSLGYGLTFGLPLHVFVCLLLGWKGCSIKSMKQELFDIVVTSSVVFTISSCCNLCERVCSCLLLMGWNGCRLVYLFAVAGGKAVPSGGARQKSASGSLSSDLLIMHGWEDLAQALFRSLGSLTVPPRFLHFSHFSCLASVYLCLLLMGWKRVLVQFAHCRSRAK